MHAEAKWLSLDTDILIRLGQGEEWMHLFAELAQEHGHALRATPMAMDELKDKRTSGRSAAIRAGARRAWDHMQEWGVLPVLPKDAETSRRIIWLAGQLRRKGWLPELEYRDSMILAQTSLAKIPVLVAIDGHYHTDNIRLVASLSDLEVPTVLIQDPRDLARRWLRR
jgi:hypothetical protein